MAMGSEQLIANEVLAFLQHAIDAMDEISIIQISKSIFSVDEIVSAKTLLYQSIGQIDRMPSRRRDEKGEKSVQDIINLVKVTDPDDVPSFVAKDLHKLPPVTFDHVDVTRLLKDITSLKASLADVVLKLEASQETICELRAEVAALRNTSAVSRSPEANNVNTRRGACNATCASFESAKLDSSPIVVPVRKSGDVSVTCPPPPPVEVSPSVVTSTPQRDYAAAAACKQPKVQANVRAGKGSGIPRNEPPRSVKQKDQPDKDGFTMVERKKRKPPCCNQCGTAPTGPNFLLRPAVPVTYLYISRLHYTSKASDVVEYLEKMTKFRVLVEKLESRNNVNFNSFVVRVPLAHQEVFLKEELWPKGVVFRKFRGRRRPPGVTRPAPHAAAKS